MKLTRKEMNLVFAHRKQITEARKRATKRAKCKHTNIGNWCHGHNSWLGECRDCGEVVEK